MILKLTNKMKPKIPHLIIKAGAGTGKTTTMVEGVNLLLGRTPTITPSPEQSAIWESICKSPKESKIGFLAYNKSIATVLKTRVAPGVEAMTIHSLGLKAINRNYTRLNISEYRVQNLIEKVTKIDLRILRETKAVQLRALERLVSLCKQNLVDPNDLTLVDGLIAHYDVDMGEEDKHYQEVVDLLPSIIDRCKTPDKDKCIDYDDMVWLPIVLNLPPPKYDILLVDEFQDTNRCTQAMARVAGTRLILCGDTNQAIYGFTGADSESMSRMYKELKATPQGCEVLSLSMTRRCGKAIVAEANSIVAEFYAHESNPVGVVEKALYHSDNPEVPSYHTSVKYGDMVLCRNNAPLVSQCFKFIKMGLKATIQGRDIGKGLITLVRKFKTNDVVEFVEKLSDWCAKELNKERAKRFPSESKLMSIQDKHDCLLSFTGEGVSTVDQVVEKIEKVFTDNNHETGIRMSSIHKAKGLEAETVWFLQPNMARVPSGRDKGWQYTQAMNLRYVAITRAISKLVHVYESGVS